MLELATPVSHLFEQKDNAARIINASDALECRDERLDFIEGKQKLFHCELQLHHKLENKHFDYVKKVLEHKPDIELVSFHMASSCTNPSIADNMFQSGGYTYNRAEMKANAAFNVEQFKAMGVKKIALENNNYYPTPAYNLVADPDLINEIVTENNIAFLFDVAHAHISAHNKGIRYVEYKSQLPLDQTVQIHICKFDFKPDGLAFDAHLIPDNAIMDEVLDLVKVGDVTYLTVEYYREVEGLITILNSLRQRLNELS